MSYNNNFYKQYTTQFDTSEDKLRTFLKKYEAIAEQSRDKFYAKHEPISYRPWDSNYISYEDLRVKRDPYIEVSMPEHRLGELVEKERWFDKVADDCEYYKAIVKQHRDDELIRNKNPAVQNAWEKYQMLLRLVK
jgi:hypothetical protein